MVPFKVKEPTGLPDRANAAAFSQVGSCALWLCHFLHTCDLLCLITHTQNSEIGDFLGKQYKLLRKQQDKYQEQGFILEDRVWNLFCLKGWRMR